MGLFRNQEIRKSLAFYLFLSVIISTLGFLISFSSGILALCACLVFATVHFWTTYARYHEISKLSDEVNAVLHNKATLEIKGYREGELSVLRDEIYKMTVKMREQMAALSSDKTYLSDSIADISHQIRTPLTSINLIVSFLQKPKLEDKRRLDLSLELMALLTRIDWLITALLKISKLDAGTANLKKDRIFVRELMNKAIEPLAIPMELRDQQLLIQDEGGETFLGDLSWSNEAIGNILKNCMEHTPASGIIEVSISENALYTEIIISDNGSGFDPEDLPHLFERFYKGKNSSDQSVGIGLALARMIITEQQGTIKAENNIHGGAKFTLRYYKVNV